MPSLLTQYKIILAILGTGAIFTLSIAAVQVFISDRGPRERIIFQSVLIAVLCFAVLAFLEILGK